MKQRLVLTPQLTRSGLNEIFSMDFKGGLGNVISHVGLTSQSFNARAELTGIPGEFERFPIKDAEKIVNKEHPQQVLFAPIQYGKKNTAVRGLGFYLPSGTLLAAYSDPQVEFYLVNFIEFKLYVHVLFKGLPADSLTVISKGTVFNPGLREFMTQLPMDVLSLSAALINSEMRMNAQHKQLMRISDENRVYKSRLERLEWIVTKLRNNQSRFHEREEQQSNDMLSLSASTLNNIIEIEGLKDLSINHSSDLQHFSDLSNLEDGRLASAIINLT